MHHQACVTAVRDLGGLAEQRSPLLGRVHSLVGGGAAEVFAKHVWAAHERGGTTGGTEAAAGLPQHLTESEQLSGINH